jgi:hypothetical protein
LRSGARLQFPKTLSSALNGKIFTLHLTARPYERL